jgi:hypothetical protein
MTRTPSQPSPPPGGSAKPARPRKPLFPNPFYVLLLVSSTAFAVTALMVYVSPFVLERGLTDPGKAAGPGSRALVDWLDRRGPFALGVEFMVMLGTALLAMATDHWFPGKTRRVTDAK